MRDFFIKIFRIGRKIKDQFHSSWMFICFLLILVLPFILGFGLLYKSNVLIREQSLLQLLFSGNWHPLKGEFGFWPFIVSSLWVTILSMLICGPVCLLSAIHLTHYAKKWVLKLMHPVIDILAGIPSVIYGVWGILLVVPFVSRMGASMGHPNSGYTILTGAIVLSIMIIPFVLNILIEVIRTVPRELSEASLSLGATKWETIKYVVLKKAFPGIISSFGLGISRAFGETIAVLMVVGNVVKIPTGVFQPGYPLPALIANNYGEMLSIPMYDSALMFSALILFVVVTIFNMGSRYLIIYSEKKI
ncbi:MAG: phosphate ABC transporter permease subunit PstC [Bacteroidetes bacterium GWC2_33_15]|nr:MAG: phosphate ABC transporter permease subunit PstC [Bacteroidetes bacterium GWA2_33_15]OFX51865.1 MAG: phosphate ABC transporter permease subunit PstC [Bacteroidetes bacterium GWC2_33_15]OFX63433.1 MAG: phosphate ABC transporter permease subunit PstC [Bacteroidetes bacterium GWB2_32_14]OFX67219.1 MAG: phosphate ABC transporter permease subunit PstC [Bacteroidetes bacterium GWD2_33_33]